MKIKIFTTDKNGKICLSKDELQEIINEAYWEGYHNGAKSEKSWKDYFKAKEFGYSIK